MRSALPRQLVALPFAIVLDLNISLFLISCYMRLMTDLENEIETCLCPSCRMDSQDGRGGDGFRNVGRARQKVVRMIDNFVVTDGLEIVRWCRSSCLLYSTDFNVVDRSLV